MTKPNQKILLTCAFLALAVAAVVVLIVFFATSGIRATPLSIAKYKENWASLEGNSYVVRGQIENRLGSTEDTGSVLIVKARDGSGRVPVLVPPAYPENFEPGQTHQFYVTVKKGTLLLANSKKE